MAPLSVIEPFSQPSMTGRFRYILARKTQNTQSGDATCEGMSELEAMSQMTKAKKQFEK